METNIKDLLVYLEFKPEDDRFFESEFLDKYPDAVNKMWRFFFARVDRSEEYPELHDLYESLDEFIKDSGPE